MIWLVLGCTGPLPTEPPTPTPTADTGPTETDAPHTGGYVLDEPWVLFVGGSFLMGGPGPTAEPSELPQHEVTVPTFAIMRHEARVGDYFDCISDGVCTPRDPSCYDDSNPNLPVNCVDHAQATAFCEWYGGRLPSESEWEFAATSGGLPLEYPWGDEPFDCARSNTGQGPGNGPSCNGEGMWEVCTHPLGDTPLGLCDMGGNAFEWVADWYWDDYIDHPTDGSPRLDMNNDFRSMRGGGIGSLVVPRVRARTFHPPDFWYGGMGVRCAMSLEP